MRRIRCVSYSEGHAVSQPVLAFLSRLGGPIFPRLQRLLCKTTSLKGAELLPLFLCPTLHTLLFGGAFVTVATAAEIIRTIETLPIAAPNLETFHLRNSTKSLFSSQDVLIDAISSSLPSLKRLKSIQLAYMPSIGSLLPTICLITRLEELYLKFNSNVTATVPELARDAFPTLKKLTIIGNMFVCTTIIDAFSTSKSCRLQELFLDIEWVPCVIATFDLGESIRTAFQLSLRALCIIADTLHPGILLTLFGCSRLEIVSVPLWMKGGGLDIALELVEMACKAWPQIKALNFQEIYESASENDSIVEDSNSDSDSNSENDMASYADADVEYSSGAEDDTDMDWDSDLDPGFAL